MRCSGLADGARSEGGGSCTFGPRRVACQNRNQIANEDLRVLVPTACFQYACWLMRPLRS